MNDPSYQPSDQPNEITSVIGRAVRLTWIMIGVAVVTIGVYLYLAIEGDEWQFFGAAGIGLAYGVACLISLRLIRGNRLRAGMQLLIYGLWVSFLALAALIANLGLILGVVIVLLTAIIAGQTLSSSQTKRTILISSGLAGLILLLDWFQPAYRWEASAELQSYVAAVVGGLVLTHGFFMAGQFANFSLQTKLVIVFVVVGVLAVSTVAVVNNWSTRTALIAAANQTLFAATSQTAASLDSFINTNLDDIRTNAQSPILVKYLSLAPGKRAGSVQEEETVAILRALSRKDPVNISSYALLDSRGQNVIDTFSPDVTLNEAELDYFQIPLQSGLPYVSPVEFSPTTGAAFLYFSSPVRNAVGEIIGVLRVRYNAAVLQQLVVQNNRLAGDESFGILLDENYIRLAHGTRAELIFKSVVPLDPAQVAELQGVGRLPDRPAAEMATNLPDLAERLGNWQTQPYFTTYLAVSEGRVDSITVTQMKTQPWLVVFAQPQDVFLAPVAAQTNNTIILAVGIIAVVVVGAVFMGQALASPLIRLTEVAQQVSQGNLEAQALIETQDETGQLAAAFNGMTHRLREMIGSLEDQVRERTAELAVSMEVGQQAAQLRNLAELLPGITELIRQRFDLYYTQIYFIDDPGQNLVLKAGTGEVGQELVARRHSLPVGAGSIVGRVVTEGRSIVVPDTETSPLHKANPLLPETRSELAIPLLIEGQVMGVLDMQANRVNTFTSHNLPVFEAMATQLAIAIDSAQQLASAQEARQKAEVAIRQLTRESWTDKLATLSANQGLGYSYDLATIRPVEGGQRMAQRIEKGTDEEGQRIATGGGQRIEKGTDEEGQRIGKGTDEEGQRIGKGTDEEGQVRDGYQRLSVPLAVQNEPIGELTVATGADKKLSADEQAFLEAVAQQLSQKAETLRLFSETQQRAAREQLARQISDKVRASRNIEQALQTAAEELAKSLGAARAMIRLRVAAMDEPTSQRGSEPTRQRGSRAADGQGSRGAE